MSLPPLLQNPFPEVFKTLSPKPQALHPKAYILNPERYVQDNGGSLGLTTDGVQLCIMQVGGHTINEKGLGHRTTHGLYRDNGKEHGK